MRGNMNNTLYVIFPEMCAVTVSIFACWATIHSWNKKHFQFSNNFLKLRGMSHASLDLKVLDTFMSMHIYPLVYYLCLLNISRLCKNGNKHTIKILFKLAC